MEGRRSEQQPPNGRLGFVITLVVVAYAGLALIQWYPLRSSYYAYEDRVNELLKLRISSDDKNDIESFKRKTLDAGKKLGIPVKPEAVEVTTSGHRWHVKVKYEREFKVPGYSRTIPYEINRSWEHY